MNQTARLETLSDGVFAIAATLLILDIVLPDRGTLTHQLVQIWPAYVAYAISFVTIGIMWINHHTVFEQIDRVNRTFLVINVFFLMVIAFIPFPTHVLAANLRHDGRPAAFFYGLTNIAMAVMFDCLWFYAARGRRLLSPLADPRVVAGISRAFLPGIPFYTLATLSALFSAWLAVVFYAALALFFVLESSLFAREPP